MLAEALNLIEQAANAENAAMETAVAALGESHARTVVDLARMPVAAEIARVLHAIRSAADAMLTGAAASVSAELPASPVVQHLEPPFRLPPAPQPDASGRIEMYGISVPSSRSEEASEVVASARTAVAQNRKANPYDHYRGKNSWCKSLFLAAFARISAESTQRLQTEEMSPRDDVAQPPSRVEPDSAPEMDTRPAAPQRPSIAGSGPLRATRPMPADQVPPTMPPRTAAPSSSRLHAHGITAQTIEDPGKSREPPAQAPKAPTRSFFKQRTR
jgi:hypothetical protein